MRLRLERHYIKIHSKAWPVNLTSDLENIMYHDSYARL